MNKAYYHATDYKNLQSITTTGIMPGIDGLVYLCESEIDALKFICLRGIKKVLICKVIINDKNVIETFDHSEAFFKCRCFGSTVPIPPQKIRYYTRYDL